MRERKRPEKLLRRMTNVEQALADLTEGHLMILSKPWTKRIGWADSCPYCESLNYAFHDGSCPWLISATVCGVA